jgi:hypothetical protein
VLTLNKLDFLCNLTGKSNYHTNEKIFFNYGKPLISPPRLRGSISIEFNIDFLKDNEPYFVYGSPIDIGGVQFGFIDVGLKKENIIEHSTCDFHKYIEILNNINKLPVNEFEKTINHKHNMGTINLIRKFFPASVASVMHKNLNPHVWIFEFCLDCNYVVSLDHIMNLNIPNTYCDVPCIKDLQKKLGNRVKYYNPKFGIEYGAA